MSWIVGSAEKALEHFAEHPEEEEFVKYLGDVFQVTYADRHKTQFSEYSYYLLKPYERPSRRYGLHGEIIAIYSPYTELQGRTLQDVVNLQQRFINRVHPIWNIIISDDPDIESNLRKFTELRELEHYNIPFSRSELEQKPTAKDINNKLEKYIHGRDLFAFNSAIQSDTFFFGRDSLVEDIIGYIENNQNFGLFGLRKIGKTSVLLAVERRLESLGYYHVVHIDCQNPAVYNRRWFSLLKYILNKLVKDKCEFCSENELIDYFLDYITKSKEKIVIIFDEIENLSYDIASAPHWKKDFLSFWGTIRAFHQETKSKFMFGVAGVNPYIFEQPLINGRDNPIMLGVAPLYLSPLDENSIRDMVRTIGRYMGLDFDEEIYSWLSKQFGGHPYLIRKVCSLIYSKVGKKNEYLLSEFVSREKWINEKIEHDIMKILVVLAQYYRDEYANLLLLSQGEKDWLLEADANYSETTKHIKEYGIIEMNDGEFSFSIGALEEFLIFHGDELMNAVQVLDDGSEPTNYSLLPEPSQIEIWSRINKKRNELEVLLRRIIFTTLNLEYGEKALNYVLDNMGGTKKAELAGYSMEQIFNGESKGLFFIDLKEIINRDWDLFKKVFGDNKQLFIMNMDKINENGRSDAHANPISEKKATTIIETIEEMSNKIRKILI